jgi:carboxyl-terminal processing protease
VRRFSLVLTAFVCAWGLGHFVLAPAGDAGSAALHAQETAPATGPGATSAPGATATIPALEAPASAQWAAAMELCQKGRFAEALADLHRIPEEGPLGKRIADARKLIEQYLDRYKKWDEERAAEFERSAERVRRSLLSQEHIAALAEANLDKPLREKVSEIDQQMARIAISEWLETAAPDKAVEMKARAAEATAKMTASLEESERMLTDDSSAFGKAFRELSGKLKQHIDAYGKSWASIGTASAKELRQAAKTVAPAEEELSDALGDLEGLVSDQPWRVGLAQARLARTVAPGKDGMNEFSWYRDLVQAVTRRGELAVKDGKWYDALNVYNGLHELDPDNEVFSEKLKVARRHVRVLGLYGKKPDAPDGAAPQSSDANKPRSVPDKLEGPGEALAEEPEPRWQELTQGVDADIVHNVIAQLDEQYVSAVDYRKLTRGALEALKVLAETPDAANSFDGLSNPAKKKQFLETIDRELDNVEKNDRVDSVYLSMVLNTILRESEKTVGIPLGVLAMEFTDGFLEELDRFSSMIWPVEMDDFNKQTMGQFYGVGIQITKEPNEPLKVVSPLANSPAFREGIKTGDLILTVDGKRTESLSVDKLVRMIQGPKGTKVVLTVRSRGQTQPRTVTLVRDEIRIHTVRGWRLEPGGDGDNWLYWVDPQDKIAYIRISQFTAETPGALDRALSQLREDGCHSLIVDLRFDPGGLLDASRQVVDEFLDGVRRIVVTRGRQKVQKEYLSTDGGAFTKGDVVVLVNELSASASEIVSGALQDCQRATIVGQRTYGKGSVQNVLQIPKHSAYLKLTTAYYYLPSGRLLHRKEGSKDWGVDPQVDVRMTPRQTRHWLTMQRKTDLLQDTDPQELSSDLDEEYKADLQLNAAVLLLRLMQLQEAPPAA